MTKTNKNYDLPISRPVFFFQAVLNFIIKLGVFYSYRMLLKMLTLESILSTLAKIYLILALKVPSGVFKIIHSSIRNRIL